MFDQLLAMGLYFSVLITIGLCSRKKNTTEKDFVLGNRKLNYWVTAISAHADDMSSWLFMAFPMAIFVSGPYKLWVGIGLILGMFLCWQFVAPRLRTQTEKYDSSTLSTFFERRFGDHSGIIRNISAIMILFFMTYYLSSGLVATGRLFESLFSINYYIGISIAILIVISYVLAGGFISVAWTDFVQGVFLLVMIMIVPIVAFSHIGSINNILTIGESKGIVFSLFPEASFTSFFAIFSLLVGWGLGYFGQPHILTKFMGIKHVEELRKSKYLGMTWQILAMTSAAAVGFIGLAFFPNGLEKPEMVFVEMTTTLFAPFVAAFIICGIFSANMSTMDSQLLVCATVMSEDFYRHILNKKASSKELVFASRAGVIIFALLAFYLAWGQSATIMSIVEYAWSGLGSSFGPLILCALYSKRVNKYGAIVGVSVGGIVAATWPTLNPYVTDLDIVPMIPGFFLSLCSIHVVSYLTRGKQTVSVSEHEKESVLA
ncbi:MAG: sodium/proline symporter [Parachlamydiaceae bacterium]|nr:sodium/proline symporter [Parachlamydiaceae bacterium]